MKRIALIAALALTCNLAQAHAVGRGSATGAASSGSQGNGSSYTLGDEYSPWPQAEMKQYAKPKFEPYRGEEKKAQH